MRTIGALSGYSKMYNIPRIEVSQQRKSYEAYKNNKDSAVNEVAIINYLKDMIIDLCEKGYEYNDNEQILTWVNKGKEFVNTDDIGYCVRLLVYEARGNRDHNSLLTKELYDTATSILTERDLYKQVDDLLDLYINVKFEILFDKYRAISDSDTNEMEVLKKQTSILYELYKRYLTLLNSYGDKQVNQEWKNDLEYIKALI